ncbi:hypothetical protein DFS33DRAFT_1383983 [Desarmillaria ectypa]|nr:hypothetical protein DFS33DRAFT_1383983 [Desarmillaria ectypa]
MCLDIVCKEASSPTQKRLSNGPQGLQNEPVTKILAAWRTIDLRVSRMSARFSMVGEIPYDRFMVVTQIKRFHRGYLGMYPSEIPQFKEGEPEAITRKMLEDEDTSVQLRALKNKAHCDVKPLTAVNLAAFSQPGLSTLGITNNLGDRFYSKGQEAGDPGTDNWEQSFVRTSVHTIFLFASDTIDNIDEISTIWQIQEDEDAYSDTYFGFVDGINEIAVKGFTQSPLLGHLAINVGIIILAENGHTTTRPPWAKDSSFLVFRQMEQVVPEFSLFLDPPCEELACLDDGKCAPVNLAPLFDDPTLAADPTRNNNFTYHHHGESSNNQTCCHTRMARPRASFTLEETEHHIICAVTPDESASNKTGASLERSLSFVVYQSDIGQGVFLQQVWVNNANHFLSGTGVDPIIDPARNNPSSRSRSITDPNRAITLQTLSYRGAAIISSCLPSLDQN